jgi:hypothetical protein
MPLDEARSTRVLMAALEDASMAKDKFEKMKKRHTPDRDRDLSEPIHPQVAESLTRSLRIDLTFKDPIDARQQCEVLAAALVRALMISQDHARGAWRQRRDMRDVLREACVEIQIMQGKRPHIG